MSVDSNTLILTSWCAASPAVAEDIFPRLVLSREDKQPEDDTWIQLLQTLNAPRLIRMLTVMRSSRRPNYPPLDFDDLQLSADRATWQSETIGRIKTYYKTVLPYETQIKIAYEIFYDQFSVFLAENYRAVVIHNTDFALQVFAPNDHSFQLEEIWLKYVSHTFSKRNLYSSLGQMLNSFKLVEREPGGFSTLFTFVSRKYQHLPVPSIEFAGFLATFYFAVLRQKVLSQFSKPVKQIYDTEQKLKSQQAKFEKFKTEKAKKRASSKISELEEKITELRVLKRKEREQNKLELVSYEEQLAQKISGIKFLKIKREVDFFNRTAGRQIRPAATVKQLIQEIVRAATNAELYELAPMLTEIQNLPIVRPGGDNDNSICYACGRVQPPEKLFKSAVMVINSSTQRTQSAFGEKRPAICNDCYCISLISPVKTGTSHLVVRLEGKQIELVGDYLKSLVMGELGIAAGRYLLFIAHEKYGADSVSSKIGSVQYAVYRMASEFEVEVFKEFQFVAVVDTNEIKLPSSQLVWLNFLINIFNLRRSKWRPRSNKDKAQFAAFGRVIRHVQKEEVIFAIYESITAGFADINQQRSIQLEKLREAHVRWLMETKTKKTDEKAQLFKDVAAMTGLLYAFCDYVRYQNRGKSKDELRRRVNKVIENCDNPNHFDYGVARQTEWQTATLKRRADTYFSYDTLKSELLPHLLTEAEIVEREDTDDKGQPTLRLYFDDVSKAYTYLFSKRYTSSKAQREFTYQLQLSLHARFPDLITANKGDE